MRMPRLTIRFNARSSRPWTPYVNGGEPALDAVQALYGRGEGKGGFLRYWKRGQGGPGFLCAVLVKGE